MAQTPTEYVQNADYKGKFGQYVHSKAPEPPKEIVPGKYAPSNPAPTNFVEAIVDVNRPTPSPGQVATFIAKQQALVALQPTGNIINAPVITGIIPGEGILPSVVDNVNIKKPSDVYDQKYRFGQKISSVPVDTLGDSFMPINDSATNGTKPLSTDTMLRDSMERAFESNAPVDNKTRMFLNDGTLHLTVDKSANAALEEFNGKVDGSGMVFPFYFQSMNYFNEHPEKYITFQATMEAIKEIYKPSWSELSFFGRTSPVYHYQNTVRTLSFNFTIWAPNRAALGLVKQRVNWLARHTYASYADFIPSGKSKPVSKIIYEAPIIKFTIGDLFRQVPAIIQQIDFDWSGEGTIPWELTKDMIMPQWVKVTLSLTILHDKFMQNFGGATSSIHSDSRQSSDFYEFIKPQNRGIEPPNIKKFREANLDEKAKEDAAKAGQK